MVSSTLSILLLLVCSVALASSSPAKIWRTPSVSLNDAQNALIGNPGPPPKQNCTCMHWKRCAEINSDVRCSPDFAFVCCTKTRN